MRYEIARFGVCVCVCVCYQTMKRSLVRRVKIFEDGILGFKELF